MEFTALILGSDANAYYMARSYHELYNKKVDMIGKAPIAVTKYSSIINFIQIPKIYEIETFIQTLNTYAEQNTHEKILLIGTNDKFVKLIAENKEKIHQKYVHNYPSAQLVNTLLLKDAFYTTFGTKLTIPKTLVYSCKQQTQIKDDFTYPVILKPGNGIAYNNHPFEGQAKVYKIQSFDALLNTIKIIEHSGYQDNLIIQEFIPGGDDALFDAVFYVSSNKKVQLMTFAQIGLQERTPTGVGNCTVLVNGFDEHGYKEELIHTMKNFLEKIEYQGFAEFDLKYDSRDGTYKILEINPRQARSSYYLTACGHNLIKYLVDDLIYHTDKQPTLMKDNMVLSFVPKSVIKKYITSNPLQNEIQKLIKEGKYTRPLHYKNDTHFLRKIYLFFKDINYGIKYKKLKW